MEEYSFCINDEIKVENQFYIVKGCIQYENINDGYKWTEYQLLDRCSNQIRWLSIDSLYEEYSIYTQEQSSSAYDLEQIEKQGYRETDSGKQKVIGYQGNMDVDMGETAYFWEYEDSEGENIIAVEQWSDGKECSRGYYLDKSEIVLVSRGKNQNSNKSYGRKRTDNITLNRIIGIIAVLGGIGVVVFVIGCFFNNSNKIHNFLEESSYFDFKTAITSEYNTKEKASVYKTTLILDEAVKKIIEGIEGDTEYVQQNTEDEDSSVAIITDKEYCLVYESEEKEVLVQVSSRSYVYGSSNRIYHGRNSTYRYYRRYYYSTVYSFDRNRYKDKNDSYKGYHESKINSTTSDTYSSYASSVRQSSIASRKSSGGGTSFGK